MDIVFSSSSATLVPKGVPFTKSVSFLKNMWLQFLLSACIIRISMPFEEFKAKMLDNELNIYDILRTDLMPSHFLISSELMDEPADAREELDDAHDLGHIETSIINGSIDAALSTLTFHRKMMNEYKCRNFIAEQILEEMGKPVLNNRVGMPFKPNISGPSTFMKKSQDLSFIQDVGSANYQDWLAKITALNDIYQHYNATLSPGYPTNMSPVNFPQSSPSDFTPNTQPNSNVFTPNIPMPSASPLPNYPSPRPPIQAYPSTGQAQLAPNMEDRTYEVHETGEVALAGYPEAVGQSYHNEDISKYSGGYEYHMPPPPPPLYQHSSATHTHVHEHTHEPEWETERDGHGGVGLSDLFDISLTGIAFLSFGMFALQVCMCITMNQDQQPPQIMQMVDTGDNDNLNMEEVFRIKRNSFNTDNAGQSKSTDNLYQGSNYQYQPNMRKPSHRDQYQRNHGSNRRQQKSKDQIERQRITEPNPGISSQILSLATLNTLSRYALMALKPRTMPCLYRALCVGNKKARDMTDSGRYWLPVWHFLKNEELMQKWQQLIPVNVRKYSFVCNRHFQLKHFIQY